MILVLLGLAALVALLFAAQAFSRARIATIKALLAWVAALAGLSLAMLLLLTGRGAGAFGALVFFAPLAWSWWREGASPTASKPAKRAPMTREEAYSVLGLTPGASEAEIRAAYLRLIRATHPDRGGSDWLAARINQARDVLLRR
ncbi:MAG TPA: DnaJ domain-containing protein [Acetobacteraceae bacterium]|nr:DnaJ domain-containing protein [Acetobacteraceae bacterium]